ncbi:MAG TPA: A24 family peptidase [Burkholderiales bacterium]|jgi:leader peptidase (prepilin peptidase)/N-methyltransferase|nr:A24 family peptidase [Burkholderiales bacterium]
MDFIDIMNEPAIVILVCALLGLVVGSFLNVVIHRLPKMLEREWDAQAADLLEQKGSADAAAKLRSTGTTKRYNLVTPPSTCPRCGHRIPAWENIPILSYLFLRARCSACKAPISIRYPIVEALSGILSGYIGWRYGLTLATAGALFLTWSLIALTVIDINTQLLPDDITLPLIWLGLLVNQTGTFVPLQGAVIGAIAGYLSLWAVYWLFKLATGKEGMGYGDFKLLAAIGAWLGWKMLPVVILLSSLVGATVGIGLIVFARHGRNTPIPFGPYIAAAGLIALFWGETINRTYLQLL